MTQHCNVYPSWENTIMLSTHYQNGTGTNLEIRLILTKILTNVEII